MISLHENHPRINMNNQSTTIRVIVKSAFQVSVKERAESIFDLGNVYFVLCVSSLDLHPILY